MRRYQHDYTYTTDSTVTIINGYGYILVCENVVC